MTTAPLYFDNNATTPLLPAVSDAMNACRLAGFANPASQHGPGRAARRRLEAARERITTLLGGQTAGLTPDRLIFTSGGTEANSLALRGLSSAASTPPRRSIVSTIEHPSIAATADQMEQEGFTMDRLEVDFDGVVSAKHLSELLERPGEVGVVSIMLGNNETGVLQPIAEIARFCHDRGVPFHTDAVQAVGKIEVDFQDLGVSALSFSGHKFHGPVGIGGLLVREGVSLTPQILGGHQQAGFRAGTESVELAVGMEAALEAWHTERVERPQRLAQLRDRLEGSLCETIPSMVIIGEKAPRLPHTSCIAFPGLDRQALMMALDLAGVACSTGSACASGSSEPSPVLLAMGRLNSEVGGALRLSLGAPTTEAEVDEAVRRISQIVGDQQASKTS